MWWCKCRRKEHEEGEWCCVIEARKNLERLALEKKALAAAKAEKESAATLTTTQDMSNDQKNKLGSVKK